MKNIKYIVSLLCLVWIVFACENYDRLAEGTVTTNAPTLSLGQSSVRLLPAEAEGDTFLIRLNWTQPRFTFESGVPAEVSDLKYTVEMDLSDNLFAHPITIATTEGLFTDIYAKQLNNWVVGLLGIEELKTSQLVEIRVKTTYLEKGVAKEVYSNVANLEVIPTLNEPIVIRWKQVEGDWTDFAVYAWGTEEVFGGWPGTVVEPDNDGWYTLSVPDTKPLNLILNNNNGGKQFDFVKHSEETPLEAGDYFVNTKTNTFGKIQPITIRWKQTAGDWSAFAMYAWGTEEIFGSWPGAVVEPDAKGWYSLEVPAARPIHLILNNNNGGKQFDFLNDPYESTNYEINTATSTWTKTPEITIRWKYTGSDWNTFAIYAWGGFPVGETFGSWPGTVVTPGADGWCSVTVPAGQIVGNAIFNNANNGGQFDVTMDITSSTCFEITSNSYTVVDCQ